MAGEKLVQKALQAAMEARATKHVADPAERAKNLASFLSRSHAKNTETGEPIRLYHITPRTDIEALKPGGFDPEISGGATWLSPYAEEQPAFHNVGSWKNKFKEGTNVMPVYANLERPLLIDTPEMISWAQSVYGRDFPLLVSPKTRQMLIEDGYDSVIYGGGKNPEEYAAKGLQIGQQANRDEQVLSLFPETQLKSATGNLGTFDPAIPRLTEAHGGEVREHHADGERVGTFDVRSVDPRLGEYSLTPREESSLPRAVQLARQIIDAQPNLPVQGAAIDYRMSPMFAGMAHEMGKTPVGAMSVPVAGGNLHLQGGYDPLTKFEHYGARYTRPFADGGSVEYQSNSLPLIQDGQINWGDPDNKADFFRASAALQRALDTAKQVEAAPMPPRVQREPLTVPRPAPVEASELPAPVPVPESEEASLPPPIPQQPQRSDPNKFGGIPSSLLFGDPTEYRGGDYSLGFGSPPMHLWGDVQRFGGFSQDYSGSEPEFSAQEAANPPLDFLTRKEPSPIFAPPTPVRAEGMPNQDFTLGLGYRFIPNTEVSSNAAMRPELNSFFEHNQPILGQLEQMMPPMDFLVGDRPASVMTQEPAEEPLPEMTTQEMLSLLPDSKPAQTAPQAIETVAPQAAKLTARLPQEATAYAPVPAAGAGNAVLRAIRGLESNDNPNAQNPRSSAGGLFQFLNSTWTNVLRRMDPQTYGRMSDAQLIALKKGRDTAGVQQKAAEYHLENDVLPALQKAGVPQTPGNIYLGWFQGPAGAVRANRAPANATVAQVFPETVKANSNMRFNGKPYAQWTMNDLRQWAESSMARRMGRAEGGEVREHHADGKLVGKALKAIRAWHGSPHKFEQFDISKVGTGEGQQRYGKGMYFAQDKNLAQQFMGNPDDRYRRLSGHMTPQEEIAFDYANRPGARDMDIMSALVKRYGNDISFEQANELARQAMARRGALYEVDIKPQMQSFLDWNRRLSEQPEYVRELLTPKNLGLREAGPFPGGTNFGWVDDTGKPVGRVSTLRAPENPLEGEAGGRIYNLIGREDPNRATDILRDLGIPGITYRDPSSFGKTNAPQNFVVFDPAKDVEILNRYNKGGEVLSDKYPTHYLPNVGRQVMQDGGTPEMSMTRARKLALEALGQSEDKPPMDPEVMGQNWANAVRRFRENPIREGEATVRPLELGARDVIGGAIAGDEANRTYLNEIRRRAADVLVGSTGLPGSGTLGFGVADLPMVTGIPLTVADIGQSVREGDYLGAGAGAALPAAFYARGPLGAAGRRALEIAREYAPKVAPAATAAAVMAPDDAEAAKAKAVQKALQTVRGTDLINKDPRVADVILSERDVAGWNKPGMLAKDVEYVISPKGDLQPWQKISPEDIFRERGYVVPALGDRSRAGAMLHEIGGVKLSEPVNLQGGGEFKRSMEDPAVWASRKGAVSSMQGQLERQMAAQGVPEDAPIFMSHTVMGYPSLDSTQMMAESILRQVEATRGKIDPKAAENYDTFVRRFYPDWPGILNPEEAEKFLKTKEAGARTSAILQALDKATEQRGGLPNLGAARLAVMEPRLVSADQLSSGFAVSRLDPTKRGTEVAHGTYTTPMFGEYRGGTEYQIPAKLMFPDWYKSLSPTYVERATGKVKETSPTMYQQALLTKFPMQRATQEWLDNIMKYVETDGKKWGYRLGGAA